MSRRIPSILTVAALAIAVLMSSGQEDSFARERKDKKKDAEQQESDQAVSATMALPPEAAARGRRRFHRRNTDHRAGDR